MKLCIHIDLYCNTVDFDDDQLLEELLSATCKATGDLLRVAPIVGEIEMNTYLEKKGPSIQ